MSQNYPSYASLSHIKMLEELYEQWLQNPQSVDSSWQYFFDGMQLAASMSKALPARVGGDLRVYDLIQAYRTYGHLGAHCNGLEEKPPLPDELKGENFGFSDQDLKLEFPTFGVLNKDKAPLQEIIEALGTIYCGTVGFEYREIGSVAIEKWMQRKIEPRISEPLSSEDKLVLLHQLNQAEGFESFLHTKYVGQKRFSLEGAESFIPLLDALLETGGALGVTQGVIGMAHRGRLNVLANVMGKSYSYIFEEFEDSYTPDLAESSGDVKYHMGFAGTYTTKQNQQIQLLLAANPSHLESVNAVVEGQARALQEQKQSTVPILIHGDAALSGQGIVYETMTLSRLNGYNTKGTIHVVINNQIGFTTLPKDCRSTRYCTDLAKSFSAPVFHVNAEDPEMCIAVAKLSMQLRQEFGCDVFIDLMGYRKYGHNEGDEPTFTQPLEYQVIKAKKTIREIYRDRLIEEGVLTPQKAEELEKKFHNDLSKVLESIKTEKKQSSPQTRKRDKDLAALFEPVSTQVDQEILKAIGKKMVEVPAHFHIHPKVKKGLEQREYMIAQDPNTPSIDWGMAEMLSYATLAAQGVHLRLSGQDCRRGTFSHRHAVFVDQINGQRYFPLSHLSPSQAPCDIFNSPLSELAVLGFEFGYSLNYPQSLVIWEAQYGDFANGAQVIIDQYIASSEMKWGTRTNLTLLLPHGYEASGPEHSSARLERFLQLCAEENMQIVNCTMPAQLFHLLRRQALRPLKKPLIVFTPKAILRHPLCKSPLNAFTAGTFEEILDDPTPAKDPKRIILCCGKMYYELTALREKHKLQDVLIRIEQVYPFHKDKLKGLLAKYPTAKEHLFVQEEHENMGAWPFLKSHLEGVRYVGRLPAASPAAGSKALHKLEQEAIIQTLTLQGSPL